MEYRKEAREAMKSKISRLTSDKDEKVDASDWKPSEPLNADVKVGMRPVSRRAYKKGGKVEAKPEGKMAKKRADRAPRKDGGKAIADAMVNRNVKDANEDREGKKHIGGMKSGGRAKKAVGGGMPYGGASFGIPQGQGKSLLRQAFTGGKKNGGRIKRAPGGIAGAPSALPATAAAQAVTNAQLGAPAGAPAAMRQANPAMGLMPLQSMAQMQGLSPTGPVPPQPTGPMDTPGTQPQPGLYKRGGKVKTKPKRPIYGGGGSADPYGEEEGGPAVEIMAPVAAPGKGNRQPVMDQTGMADMAVADPYEDRPNVEGMEAPLYNRDVGEAVGHAIAAYHRMQARHARKSGGRVGKAGGGGFGEAMNNPKAKSDAPKKKGGPNINITINTAPKLPPIPPPGMMGLPPMPPPPPEGAPGMPPGMAPTIGDPAAPGANPLAGLAAGAMGGGSPMGGPPAGGAPKLPFKRGGRVAMKAGAGSGEGRLEKIAAYGKKA